ncbi:MAG: hypothetical protein E7270_09650 [Lachnospiraceae bacterium]|nr:hypothetical protein [Lachnospiraceae bacterium]
MEFLILILSALIISSIGYYKYIYFISLGYGFSVVGLGAAMLIMFRNDLKIDTIVMCVLFIVYGFRLGGYLCIVYIMFGGARRLEIRQNRNYGNDPEYQEYVKKTPILIPLIPLYSVEKYKFLVG